MKKIIAVMLVLVLAFSIIGCAKQAETNIPSGNENTESYADAKAVLEAVWAKFGEADKFPVGGGDSENLTTDGPGKFDVAKTEELDVTLALPASQHANVEDAASMMHMMNANMFTGAAYKVKEGVDTAAFAADFKAGLDSRQWMCGFPEQFVVIQSGDYVITAFGNTLNITALKTKALEALSDSTVLAEGNITLVSEQAPAL